MKDYFGIGVYLTKGKSSIRENAQFFWTVQAFTILMQHKWLPGNTLKTWRNVAFFNDENLTDFMSGLPLDCELIGLKLCDDATDIADFKHPKRAVYVLSAENTGLPEEILTHCKAIIKMPGKLSMNITMAGSVVMYDRYIKSIKAPKI